MRWIVDFSKPFRMPDFFLISGLFFSRTINVRTCSTYLDKKVIHFAYFYLLWLGLTLLLTDNDVLRSNPIEFAKLYAWNIIQPTGVLWFVHMLAVFYVITRLLAPPAQMDGDRRRRRAADRPSRPVARHAELHPQPHDGVLCVLLPRLRHPSGLVFDVADRAKARPWVTLAVVAGWAVCNFWLVEQNFHKVPVYGLMMGLAGALAVVEIAALLSKWKSARFLRYCGQNSIVIYLTFIFPLTILERTLASQGWIADVGTATLVILVVSAVTPLLFHLTVKRTPLIALYVRPQWAKIGGAKPKLAAAAA
jgi:uncharacterized membrane protein YcfT